MEIVASLIKLFFGSKADKDRKQIEPYLEKIKAVYPSIEALSNDELRARSEALKKQIADFIARDEADIVELKAKLELPETSLEEKERISKEIDETTKRIDEKIEEKLDEILPEAFAIMKDTARRFAQNDEVVVTANDFDRDLAAEKDFVRIEGDKAVYANHWMAGGNDLKWDMIHYDVQLFGGVVLHKGKIAEMATGEGKTLVATLPVFLNALAKKGVHLVTVNTRNILFICGGAFPDLDEIIKERLTKTASIGFNSELKDKYDKDTDILSKVTVEDIRKFGMIPEFIGRLPIICTLQGLSKEMLVKILKEPKNAILKQYQKLLELDEVKLEFTDDALDAIAEKAMKRDTGARALRSIIEDFMLDIMYEIPKDDNIGRVTITREYIEGTGGPIIDIRSNEILEPVENLKQIPAEEK